MQVGEKNQTQPITVGQVNQLFRKAQDGQIEGWGRYVIRTKKWTKPRMIKYLQQRYTINQKLKDLIQEIDSEPL